MHDRDSKFFKSFNAKFASTISSVKIAEFRAPNTKAYVERFIQSIQQECLDHFIAFGRNHLDYLCKEYVEHYHTERPHQGLNNELVVKPPDEQVVKQFKLKCKERLGGVLRSYSKVGFVTTSDKCHLILVPFPIAISLSNGGPTFAT